MESGGSAYLTFFSFFAYISFAFLSFFLLFVLRTPNHAEHPSMQGYRLAVLKADLSYTKNTKGVLLTRPDVLVI